MTVIYRYAGPDLESASHEELAVQSARLNAALTVLGNGWMLNADTYRRAAASYPEGERYFPDATSALIEEERRAQYNRQGRHFETVYTLAFTYKGPAEVGRRLSAFFFEGEPAQNQVRAAERTIDLFEKSVEQLEDALSSMLSLRRLEGDDLVAHVHTCITGLHHPVRVASIPAYLDFYLGSQDFYGGFAPRIGELHIRPVAITGFPADSSPEILDFLTKVPMEYRWSNRFVFLDPHTAERQLKTYRRNWFQKRMGLMGLVKESFQLGSQTFANQDAVMMANDADQAVAEASSNTVRYGYYTSVVIVMDADPAIADTNAREVAKQLQHHGFPARIEDANAVEAYLGSLPATGWPNVRRPLINTLNLADLFPDTSVAPGHATNPSPYFPPNSPALTYTATTGSTPFRLNLHVSDVGHTLAFGPTGSGKSTLLGLLMAQFFRYPRAQVFAFDKGLSSYILAKACGAEHYDIYGDENDPLAFYPLASIQEESERVWAEEWLENLLFLQGVPVTPAQRKALHRALQLLASSPPDARTLTDLTNTLQDHTLRDGLFHYTLGGAMGRLLDANRDSLGSARFQVFEMERMMNMGEKNLVPVLLYLFHRIDQRLTGEPTLVVIDEAWVMLAHSLFGAKIEEWLRTLRKRNAAVVFASQSISEVAKSTKRDVVIESCPTKIFLPNPQAQTEHSSALYRSLGLSERQIELLAHASPKRHYYYVSPVGRRLIDLLLGPVALAFTGATSREDIGRANDFIRDFGEEWPAQWLRDRGVTQWANIWGELHKESPAEPREPEAVHLQTNL